MKKIKIFLGLTFIILAITSCKMEYDNWYSETSEMSGEWHVTVLQSMEEYDAIFGSGTMPSADNVENWTWEDIYETGFTKVFTYNTAKNIPTEMIVEDNYTFWNYKVKVNCNVNDLSFSVTDSRNLFPDTDAEAYEFDVTIIKGKILKGAVKMPSGAVTDSIVFYAKFSDDKYGFTYQKVSGFKKTGFLEDEP